jgi:hypothetical protein
MAILRFSSEMRIGYRLFALFMGIFFSLLLHGVSCAPRWESTKPCPISNISTEGCATTAPIYVNRETTVNGEVINGMLYLAR